jgi:beta-glucosidase
VPALTETDASLGVAWVGGLRKDGATALPSGLAQAASWDPDLLYRGGAMIGAEARAKGFNVLLAGGVNLMRDPRNGRTFEYLAEDPLLSGDLVGAAIAGIQSNHIISTIKHFALNGQETGRKYVDVRLPKAARESDLLAFQIGIEKGQPGAVMCAYNRIDGAQACASDWALNTVLKGLGATRASSCRTGARCPAWKPRSMGWTSNRAPNSTRRSISPTCSRRARRATRPTPRGSMT